MAERPTPRSIAVCTLIALHSDSSSPLHDIEYNDEELSGFLHGCILKDTPSNDLRSFLKQAQQQTAAFSTLLACLKRASTSIDALVDLFSSFQAAIADGTIDSSSANGICVRNASLGFDQLSFEAVTRLWKALQLQLSTLQENEEPSSDDEDASDEDNNWPQSPEQMEQHLHKQCMNLERHHSDLSFEATEVEVRRLLEKSPELPSAHFLRFLSCMQHGEKVAALDALHQYFDYAMIQEQKAETLGKSRGIQVFQYAAVLLATYYHKFGDELLSKEATQEAVRVAQQSGDAASVAYALGWLSLHTNDEGESSELLRRTASRAAEGKQLRPLVAGANLELTRRHWTPRECWQSLLEATTDPPPSSTTIALDRPTHMTNLGSNQQAMALLARQVLMGAGVWESFGFSDLSGLACMTALECFSQYMIPQEICVAVQNLVRSSLSGPSSMIQSTEKSSTCRYASALRMLILLHKEFQPSDTMYHVALLLHEWAVRRGEFGHAQHLSGILHSCLNPCMSDYTGAYIETMSQYALLLSRQGHVEKAKHWITKLCQDCKKDGLRVQQHAHLLVQHALLFLDSDNQTGALPPLLECLSMCKEHSMDSFHAVALSILAQVQMKMGNTKQAIAMVKAVLPNMRQHAHVWFVGEAYLTLAKCHLQRAKQITERGSTTVTGNLRDAAVALEQSARVFGECQDAGRLRQVYYLLARTYNSLPSKQQERNEASRRFVKVSLHLSESNEKWLRGSLTDMRYLEELASRPAIDE